MTVPFGLDGSEIGHLMFGAYTEASAILGECPRITFQHA